MLLLEATLVCYVMIGAVSTETSVKLLNQELLEPQLSVQKRQVPPFGFHVGPAPEGLRGPIAAVRCHPNPCQTYCDRVWAQNYPLVNGTCTFFVEAEMTGLIFSSLKASASCCCHDDQLIPGPGHLNPRPPFECQRAAGRGGMAPLADCRRVQCWAFCREYGFGLGDCTTTDSTWGHERLRGRFQYHSADCKCWHAADVARLYADFTLALVNRRVDLYGADFCPMPVPGGSAAGGGAGPVPGTSGMMQYRACALPPTPSQIPPAWGEICLPPPPDVKMFLCAEPLSAALGRKRQLELPSRRKRGVEKRQSQIRPC